MMRGNLASIMLPFSLRTCGRVVVFSLAALGGLGAGGCRDERTGAVAVKPAAEYFPGKVGERAIRFQLAILPAEMQRGLMERTSLGPDDGMLFVYPVPSRQEFWMRNTLLPLDIGYFTAAGELREIHPMYPRDETRVPSVDRHIQFALEMNQGWFKERGVRPGARLDLGAVKAAIKARGLNPELYGFQ